MLNQKADMADDMLRKRRGCLPYVLGFIGLCACLFLYGIINARHRCVEMPNGFLIGRATVFSSLYGWDSDIAIKYPDGRLFLRGDKRMRFWDVDSFAGEFYDTLEGYSDEYVYLNDGGLILESEQPELYRYHYDRKIAQLSGSPLSTGGHVFRTYLVLHEDPANRRSWCKTDWFWPQQWGFFPLTPYHPKGGRPRATRIE